MRATQIRTQNGNKPESYQLEHLVNHIVHVAESKGFKTDGDVLNGTSVKIGLRMISFRIITAILGHNGRRDRYTKSPKGYKRTDVPTWSQREDFNHLVNDAFDKFGLVAVIKSGNFTVRTKEGRVNEWDDNTQGSYFSQGVEVLPETEMRELCDSDKLEAEHKAAMKIKRFDIRKEFNKDLIKVIKSKE